MAIEDVVAPEENHEYEVCLGQSLLAGGVEDTHAEAVDDHGAAHALFQYKFTPASVDTAIPGLVSIDEAHGVTVLRGTTAKSDEGISFKGKLAEQKDTECLLIFDGESFRLERCDMALSQLRHMRAVPAQRLPPSAYPSNVNSKKSFKLPSATVRTGKPGRPRKAAAAITPTPLSSGDQPITDSVGKRAAAESSGAAGDENEGAKTAKRRKKAV